MEWRERDMEEYMEENMEWKERTYQVRSESQARWQRPSSTWVAGQRRSHRAHSGFPQGYGRGVEAENRQLPRRGGQPGLQRRYGC